MRNKLVVELNEKSKETASGIILSSADPSEANFGTVIAVGSEVTEVSVGDIILPNWNNAEKTRIDGADYFMVNEEDIVLIMDLEA